MLGGLREALLVTRAVAALVAVIATMAACSTGAGRPRPVIAQPLQLSSVSGIVWTADGIRLSGDDLSRKSVIVDAASKRLTSAGALLPDCPRPDVQLNAAAGAKIAALISCPYPTADKFARLDSALAPAGEMTSIDSKFGRPQDLSYDSSRGEYIAAFGDTIYNSISLIGKDGRRLPRRAAPDLGWDPERFFAPSGTTCCDDDGRAATPAWDNGGKQLLFTNSPDSKGKSGDARLFSGWELRIAAGWGLPSRVLGHYREVRTLAWSPDGSQFALAGCQRAVCSAWIVDPSTGEQVRLPMGEVSFVAWSPDGSQIAGAGGVPGGESKLYTAPAVTAG